MELIRLRCAGTVKGQDPWCSHEFVEVAGSAFHVDRSESELAPMQKERKRVGSKDLR